ncbi:hypothetical protein HYX13_04695, partial [Candidatus Woesearchaeota archaeon]|nr:hypothetical protein [Candidatus Woesearchaeota archaeon]
AEALSGKVKAEKVRTPSGRKARVTEEESFTAEEPRVRTPPRAGARTTAEPEPEPTIPVEPIILPDVILYDAKGKAFHKYKKVTVSGESIKTASGYVMKTQDEWTAFYADKREKNISLPLFYAVLERLVDEKHPALAGLAKDLKDSYLSMGTRINYDKDFIIHNYGTPDAETFHCPLPASDWMETAKGTKAGKNAFKAFLMAKDVDKADEVLRKVCGVKPYLWTPDAENRKAVPERAVFVYANSVWLSLGCGSYLGDHGRSRSVVVE